MNEKPTVFSICVLTFNRGQKALNIAKVLLPQLDDDWELLFLDNCSVSECEYYRQLSDLGRIDPRITYIRHANNRQFPRNFLASFEMAKAPHIMVVSDEDFANPDMIRNVLPLLHQYPSVGIMRGGVQALDGVAPRNTFVHDDKSFRAGEEALLGFAFKNNYFSGTIYNRQTLLDLQLVHQLTEKIDDYGVAIYPHLYMELLACAKTDVVTTAQIACFEGHEQMLFGNAPDDYCQPYSFGSRVDQFIIMRDNLVDAIKLIGEPFDKALFAGLYLQLCERYMFMTSQVNAPMYQRHHIHPGLLHQAMYMVCCSAITMFEEIADFHDLMLEEIKKLHDDFDIYAES